MSDEIKPEIIEKTQKTLGKYVRKPTLSEKLLKKPPFRFLHDIVTVVIRNTGFLKGLFSETELISDNVKEREAKIAFLTKLVEAVKTISETDLKAKPSKIIAGLEPTETNKLLQTIAFALDKKLDSTAYVKKFGSKSKVNEKPKKPLKIGTKDEKNSVRARKHEPEAAKSDKTKKIPESNREEKTREKTKKRSKKDLDRKEATVEKVSPKLKEEKIETSKNVNTVEQVKGSENVENTQQSTVVEEKYEKNIPKKENIEQEVIKDNEHKEEIQRKSRSDRPKSARLQSGDLKKATHNKAELIDEDIKPTAKGNATAQSMSVLRPPSVRPSSARPGAPRLRPDSALPLQEMVTLGKINVIVENYNTKELDEEETVVIQNAEMEPEPVQQILDIPDDKGHLVEQILEQIHDDDVVEHIKAKNEIDWEGEGFRNRDATNREITQLRSQIQSLTKVANPLGKLMNYLHEDVESMLSELNMWMNMKTEMHKEINKQSKVNEESTKPLMLHLQELEDNIKKQEVEIVTIRANILRNELRIRDLLMK